MNKVTTIFIFLLFLFLPVRIFAQQTCPGTDQDPCANYANNDPKKSECYQNVSDACHSQSNTLSSQINYMNSQIQLTTIRINAAKVKIDTLLSEINQLETEVQRLEGVLNTRVALLLHRIPAAYKRSITPQFGMLLFSRNLSDLINRAKYLQTVQNEDAALVFQVKATQNSYNDSKQVREDKKKQLEQIQQQLEAQNVQLTQQKQAKDALLAQTQGQESIYQQLLAQAKAQLAGFASFADSQGATVLSGQTSCDGWGCYYNQRDSQWATALINGQGSGCNGPCTVMRVGCLITSIAMVASHLGHKDILPSDIAFSSPSNFSVGTALLMRGTINVKGMNITRTSVSGLSPDAVKDGPVIVGIFHGSFGQHFVVIKSYTNGNYIMNDPYEEGGHDISFTDRYSLGSIFEVDRVSM
jgi:peptidoglycan hydrolase CwlO-like protein